MRSVNSTSGILAPEQLSGGGSPAFFDPDRFWLGLVAGFVLPLLMLISIYQYEFRRFSVERLLELLKMGDMLQSLVALALIPNFVLFFFVLQKQWNQLGRGVVGTTLIWIVAYLLYEYVL